jgi:hypothetical protein
VRRTLGFKPQRHVRRAAEEQRVAETFRRDVYHRAEGRSQLTGAVDYPMDPHHAIPKAVLKRVAPELLWDADNGMLLTRQEHDDHHYGNTRISFEQLPDYIVRFAERHDLVLYLEQAHPRRETEDTHA